MAGYNSSLDKEHFAGSIESENDRLLISVHSYNGGDRKIQIGGRVYEKKNGTDGFRKAGRLTVAEFKELVSMAPEILEAAEAAETD